jgi:hypothetical protein
LLICGLKYKASEVKIPEYCQAIVNYTLAVETHTYRLNSIISEQFKFVLCN